MLYGVVIFFRVVQYWYGAVFLYGFCDEKYDIIKPIRIRFLRF